MLILVLGRMSRFKFSLTGAVCLLGAACAPAYGQFATVINVPPNPDPEYIFSDTQVNVLAGGALGAFLQSGVENGSTRNIEINVSGGSIGRQSFINAGTVLNVSAGTVGYALEATARSVINISGGTVEHSLSAENGAIVNVTGGMLGEEADISDAQLTVNGGSVGDDLGLFDGATLEVLSGNVGGGLHLSESTANFSGGATGGGILITESTMNIMGGAVGNSVNAAHRSKVNISSGSLGARLLLQTSSVLNMEGGSLGPDAEVRGNDAVANISGGAVGPGMHLELGGVANVSGGTIEGPFRLNWGRVNYSGGAFAGEFIAREFTTTNIFGSQFVLDGADITSTLSVGEPFRVTSRNVPLSGVLSDGTPFSFDLNTAFFAGEDQFSNQAFVYLHREAAPGDFNGDGLVDGEDFLIWQRGAMPTALGGDDLGKWRSGFGAGAPTTTPGDFDGDGAVDGADFLAWQRDLEAGELADWRGNFGTAPAAGFAAASMPAPEPSAVLLVTMACLWALRRNRGFHGYRG
jgi:hypothetical protein